MDTLTHALSGALLARATDRPGHRSSLSSTQRCWVGFLAAAFPDIDFLLRFLSDDLLLYLNYHRGITHSLLLLPLWAWLLSVLLARLMGQGLLWRALYFVCCLSLAIHILGDVITSYGTKILAPLSDWGLSLDAIYVIDPWFGAIIVLGLVMSIWLPGQRRYAVIALIGLTIYVGIQIGHRNRAVAIGIAHAQEIGLPAAKVHGLPQPLSPLHWQVIVEAGQDYEFAYLRLSDQRSPVHGEAGLLARIASAYQPPGSIIWQKRQRVGVDTDHPPAVQRAWQDESMQGVRDFARFPALVDDRESPPGCVQFYDQRFELPELWRVWVFGDCD